MLLPSRHHAILLDYAARFSSLLRYDFACRHARRYERAAVVERAILMLRYVDGDVAE